MRARQDRTLDHREYPVLYVDSEPESLRIFELGFRREFSVLTARSGEEALAKIHGAPIALVLCEQGLSGTSGVELLARARELDPRTVRMLVSARVDAEMLRLAINRAGVSRVVPKPWVPDAMREALHAGIEAYALAREREQLLRELALLHRVGRSMAQEFDVSALKDLLLAVVTEDLGYDAAALLLLDPQREQLVWERFAPREDEVSDALRAVELSQRSAPAFLRRICNGEAQLLPLDPSLQLEGALRRWVTEVAAEELLVVALLGSRGALGALAVDNRRGGRRFTGDDQTLLEGLAGQWALALENARMVQALRGASERGQGAAAASLDPRAADC